MNHPYIVPKFREEFFRLNLCYLFIVAVCLSDVALVNAQVPPPPGRTPGRVYVPPPRGRTPVGQPPAGGETPLPRKPTLPPFWFNVAWITAAAGIIAAIAALIRSLRKG